MTRKSLNESLDLAKEILFFIESEKLSKENKQKIIDDSIYNFTNFVNEGILHERKSVSSDYSFVEWEDDGVFFRDTKGNEFIDCLGGYGVFLLGHRHPKVIKAVESQLKRCALHSQELVDPLRGYLAKLLAYITPGDLQNCYFVNSGSEAVEMALKLARLATGNVNIVSTYKGFHGQSFGALSATGKEIYRQPYMPLVPGFHHVTYGDIEAMEKIVGELYRKKESVAAIIVETIQGEGGINIPPPLYLPELRKLCDKFGCLLIVDEVQTGMGRTGKLFGVDWSSVVPDIMCLGKALGGGVVPIAGIIAKAKCWERLKENSLLLATSTFGGNPLSCAGAIAAIKTTLEDNIPRLALEKGDYILESLKRIQQMYPQVLVDVRGKGLLIGLEFATNELGFTFSKGLFDDRILVGGTINNAKVIRFEPPAIITYEQIDSVLYSIEKNVSRINNDYNRG